MASWRREVGETIVDRAAVVDRVVRVVSPSIGARMGTTPMRWNKFLQPTLRRGGACSGDAAELGRRGTTGLEVPVAQWQCIRVCGIWIGDSRSARCRRSVVVLMWWARWLVMLLLVDVG